MPLKVHFYQINSNDEENLLSILIDNDIDITTGKAIPEPANYQILVHASPTGAWLKASAELKAVINPWAGVSEKTRKMLKEFPNISLHNLHHNNFNTAELGFALLLSAAKFIIPMDKALRANDWSPRYENPQAILLRGKKALILGYGEIGKALADYCLGFGMKVMATKNHITEKQKNSEVMVYSSDQLNDLLPSANILLIALPLTDKTEDLIGGEEINQMQEGSIIVNIGRGPIINQEALYKALQNGHLKAAASDVWYNYPKSKNEWQNTPPADLPFGTLDNFVLSPHRGGLVEGVEQQRMHALADLLNAANRGEPIPNKVDLNKGY
jgi:phosphoglycerate dehydrogenase-like enzyme